MSSYQHDAELIDLMHRREKARNVFDAIKIEMGDGNGTLGDVAETAGVASPTASRYFSMLEDAGYVDREGRSTYTVHEPMQELYDAKEQWGWEVAENTLVHGNNIELDQLDTVFADQTTRDVFYNVVPRLRDGESVTSAAENVSASQPTVSKRARKLAAVGLLAKNGTYDRTAHAEELYELIEGHGWEDGLQRFYGQKDADRLAEGAINARVLSDTIDIEAVEEDAWFDSPEQEQRFYAMASVFEDGGTIPEAAEALGVNRQEALRIYQNLEGRGAFEREDWDGTGFQVSDQYVDEFGEALNERPHHTPAVERVDIPDGFDRQDIEILLILRDGLGQSFETGSSIKQIWDEQDRVDLSYGSVMSRVSDWESEYDFFEDNGKQRRAKLRKATDELDAFLEEVEAEITASGALGAWSDEHATGEGREYAEHAIDTDTLRDKLQEAWRSAAVTGARADAVWDGYRQALEAAEAAARQNGAAVKQQTDTEIEQTQDRVQGELVTALKAGERLDDAVAYDEKLLDLLREENAEAVMYLAENEAARDIFSVAVEELGAGGSLRGVTEASDWSQTAVKNHYSTLNEAGLFDHEGERAGRTYSTSPIAEALHAAGQKEGLETVLQDILTEVAFNEDASRGTILASGVYDAEVIDSRVKRSTAASQESARAGIIAGNTAADRLRDVSGFDEQVLEQAKDDYEDALTHLADNEIAREVLTAAARMDDITMSGIKEDTGRSWNAVARHFGILADHGLLGEEEDVRGGYSATKTAEDIARYVTDNDWDAFLPDDLTNDPQPDHSPSTQTPKTQSRSQKKETERDLPNVSERDWQQYLQNEFDPRVQTTEDWDEIDMDALRDILDSDYGQAAFVTGVTVLPHGGSRRQMAEEANVSRNSVDNRYSQLEDAGVFRNQDNGYEVNPAALDLAVTLQDGGWGAAMDEIGEHLSYPAVFADEQQWDAFTGIIEAFRAGESRKDANDRRDVGKMHIQNAYDVAKDHGFVSDQGEKWWTEYEIDDAAIAASGFATELEAATFPGLAQTAHETAQKLETYTSSKEYFGDGWDPDEQEFIDNFRQHWQDEELPEGLIIPQWRELLACADVTTWSEGTIGLSGEMVGTSIGSLRDKLERLEDDAVTVYDPSSEHKDVAKKYHHVQIHPRFQDTFEQCADKLPFDPEDVRYGVPVEEPEPELDPETPATPERTKAADTDQRPDWTSFKNQQ